MSGKIVNIEVKNFSEGIGGVYVQDISILFQISVSSHLPQSGFAANRLCASSMLVGTSGTRMIGHALWQQPVPAAVVPVELQTASVPAVLRADLEILNQDFDVRGARPPHLASDNSLELLMNAWNTSVARRTAASLHNPQICRTPHELRMRHLRRAAPPRNSRDLNVQESQGNHVPPVSRNTSGTSSRSCDVVPRLPDASVARSIAVYNLRSEHWSMHIPTSCLTRLKAVNFNSTLHGPPSNCTHVLFDAADQ
ncbi:hypothetical protein C8J57DRAFT_1730809 [Mycena rebaudengoi]|nr:hypothetical protein C8J57DRAFT_1730809 [Mycena rebaudengoi]